MSNTTFDLTGFETLPRDQGQIVEVSYRWRNGAFEKKIYDQCARTIEVYRLDPKIVETTPRSRWYRRYHDDDEWTLIHEA